MAVTEFGTNSPQAVKVWSKLLFYQAIYKTFFKKFLGDDVGAIVRHVHELERTAGDEVKYDLRVKMGGYGVRGDNPLRGNEEQLTFYQDTVRVDQLRQGHAFRRMSQQRTHHNLRAEARDALKDWFAERWDELMFGQLAGSFGDTPAAPPEFQSHGGNTLVAPDAGHLHDKATETFRTNHIEQLVEKAKNADPLIEPANVNGMELFCLVVHPNCITDLRTGSTGNEWKEITKFAHMGDVKQNPFFTGAVGMWANTVIYDSTRVPLFSSGANLYCRGLFLGRGAGVIAFGNPYSKIDQESVGSENMMSWFEETADYGNEKGVAAGAVFGIKPSIFNSKRHGMIAFNVLAASHT